MPPSSNDLPFARNIHARARDTCARACTYRRVHVHNLAAVVSLEQGGIIRSATINPNDDDDDDAERASWRSSRTSFQATSVTLRAHLLPHLYSRSSILFPFAFPFVFVPFLSPRVYLYPDFYIYLYLSPHLHPFHLSSLDPLFSFSIFPRCLYIPHSLVQLALSSSLPTLFKLLVLTSVLRDRKLSSFHNHFADTIRQQFLSTVETRDCNCVLSEHSNNSNTIKSCNFYTLRIAKNMLIYLT